MKKYNFEDKQYAELITRPMFYDNKESIFNTL